MLMYILKNKIKRSKFDFQYTIIINTIIINIGINLKYQIK